MLLELITGRRPVDASQSYVEDSLVEWVSLHPCCWDWRIFFSIHNLSDCILVLQARPVLTRALESDDFDELVDPRLQNSFDHNEMARMVACAAACVRHSARRRPRMSQVNFCSLRVEILICKVSSDQYLLDTTSRSSVL